MRGVTCHLVPPKLVTVGVNTSRASFLTRLHAPNARIQATFCQKRLHRAIRLQRSLVGSTIGNDGPTRRRLVGFVGSRRRCLRCRWRPSSNVRGRNHAKKTVLQPCATTRRQPKRRSTTKTSTYTIRPNTTSDASFK